VRRGVARAHHDLSRAGEACFELLREIQDQGSLLSGMGCFMMSSSRYCLPGSFPVCYLMDKLNQALSILR
jgi:hypothetical protein